MNKGPEKKVFPAAVTYDPSLKNGMRVKPSKISQRPSGKISLGILQRDPVNDNSKRQISRREFAKMKSHLGVKNSVFSDVCRSVIVNAAAQKWPQATEAEKAEIRTQLHTLYGPGAILQLLMAVSETE